MNFSLEYESVGRCINNSQEMMREVERNIPSFSYQALMSTNDHNQS